MEAIVGVVDGALLGYIANYLQMKAQIKSQNARDFGAWRRAALEKDIAAPLLLLQHFQELTEAFAEAHEDKELSWSKQILERKQETVNEYISGEMVRFGPSIRTGDFHDLLDRVDKLTDIGAECCLEGEPTETTATTARQVHRDLLRVEDELTQKYQELVRETFGVPQST